MLSTTQVELNQALPFRDHLAFRSPDLCELREQLLDAVKTHRGKQRSRDHQLRRQLGVLLANLVWAHHHGNGWLGIARGKSAYQRSRYRNPEITHAILIGALLEPLIDLGVLEQRKGFYLRRLGEGKRTRIRAIGAWADKIKAINPAGIYEDLDRETVELRTVKEKKLVYRQTPKPGARQKYYKKSATRMEYGDTEFTLQARENLRTINRALRETWINLFVPDTVRAEISARLANDQETSANRIDTSRKVLKRVFNDASFERGGRFYGGWWQGIPKEYRPYVTINNELCAEYDYKELHINMLYNLAGTEGHISDHYALDEVDKKFRNTIKLATQILINHESQNAASATIKDNFEAEELPMDPDALLKTIKEKHQPIKKYFFTGIGKRLQRIDSEIAETVMLRSIKELNTVALPVHDSFIAKVYYIEDLRKMMEEEYKKKLEGAITVEAKESELWDPYDLKESPANVQQHCRFFKEQKDHLHTNNKNNIYINNFPFIDFQYVVDSQAPVEF